MGEIDLCGESGRALPSLKWLGECQAKFPSEMLGMAQTQRAAMFLWEQGSLGCTGIDAVSLWDPLSWVPKVALGCLCSSPTQLSSQDSSESSPKLMALLMFLWGLFLGLVPPILCPVGWNPALSPPVPVSCLPWLCRGCGTRAGASLSSQNLEMQSSGRSHCHLRQNYFHRRKKILWEK